METRNGLIVIGLFVLLFGFTFVFCLDALRIPNTFYGILALIGFIVCIASGLFNGAMSHREGEALSLWFYTYAIIVSIIFVWYLTRCGTAFKWW
jgi:hypothetical protein